MCLLPMTSIPITGRLRQLRVSVFPGLLSFPTPPFLLALSPLQALASYRPLIPLASLDSRRLSEPRFVVAGFGTATRRSPEWFVRIQASPATPWLIHH
ncbi:hypothetical protein BDV98DRAFT_576616 [Pterulicium gracile]|uniref:Uncharacterized protein n=1 Tax=Pterulicium gracile TaxID=1884261 RepID=A0A5C3Q1Y7_9AGAR|nr:hypothetical protein BDV98DRAFT_576616 [Pterula gracilis]